jgi:hypothetical protein
VKLLTNCTAEKKEIPIQDKTYYNSNKKMCKELTIPSKHYLHIGRTAGNVLAEIEELDETNIQDLGNWNLNTRREVYSTKLPMKAIQIILKKNPLH